MEPSLALALPVDHGSEPARPPTPAPPQSDSPLPAPFAGASAATDPLLCTAATAPQNYRWRGYRYLPAIPTHLPKSPCATPRGLRCAPDSAEIPPPLPSGGSYFPACAVPVPRSQLTCHKN